VAQGIPAEQVGVFAAQENFPLTEFRGGGTTNLDPETADTFTAGVVIQPTPIEDLSLTIDYYRIEIDNAIGSIDLEGALDQCFASGDPDSQFCSTLVRGPSGDITEYTNPQFNLAAVSAEGVDITLNYSFDLGDRLALSGDGAYVALQVLFNHAMETTSQAVQGAPVIDCAGYYGGACRISAPLDQVAPRYRSSTRLSYYSGPLTVALNWRWLGELENHLDITCAEIPSNCYTSELGDIDDRNYFELSGRFAFGERGEVYGGVSNLFEEDPPLMGFGATQSNTAPQLYDVFGRRYFVGLRLRL
jgi:outer membrane receptor protein involved in Fe transport